MKQRLSLIWAMTTNRVIGMNGRLAWDLPNELAHYRATTAGKPIIMGRRTYESGSQRPGQLSIVLSRSGFQAPGVVVARNLDEALAAAAEDPSDEAFVIGGREPYRLALPRAHRLYATFIDAELEGDAFFPPFDFAGWRVVESSRHAIDERHPYAYAINVYERERQHARACGMVCRESAD